MIVSGARSFRPPKYVSNLFPRPCLSTLCATTQPSAETKAAARAKRKAKLGLAKAIDRGMPNVMTYRPATVNGQNNTPTFVAHSGLPDRTTPFTVLGIESSCDDTGAAIVRSDGTILGEALAKQIDIHQQWGGVVPSLARDAHLAAMDGVVEQALNNANMTVQEVDAIAVTIGPGLEICLRVGAQKAVALATQYNKPFVGVHHLEAHILMARLPFADENQLDDVIRIPATETTHESERTVDFPFLALLVSGGHCQLMQVDGIGQYQVLGGTLDDSLGEAYDKVARLIGLPVGGGGGPAVEKLAVNGNKTAFGLTVPMSSRKDCDFSFAGLKSSVRRAAERLQREKQLETTEDLGESDKADIAANFQHVALRHIEHRVKRAMDGLRDTEIRNFAVVGGVAANQELRTRLDNICNEKGWKMFVPPPRLCTDQGAMTAWAAVERLMLGSSDAIDETVYARYPFARLQDNC